MKRAAVAVAAVVGLLFFTRDAHAFELGTPETKSPYRSAQNFALEIRVSPYYPQIDEEPGLQGQPFKTSFGASPRMFLGLELDWQFWRIPGVGTIGPGLGVGFVSMSRTARTVSGRESGDEYGLSIYPLYLAAVLRIDTLWRSFGFPLMPYGKAGVGVGLWEASDATGTARFGGVKGSGASTGTHAAVGVALPLDFFDRGASRTMDATTGINTTSIYLEYYWLSLNGFGGDSFRVGTSTWAAGMVFEF
ncbi:MAG: hypothetical protein KIT84_01640 [Labilithrix sp.]|nr:hypothetical protein [Labilithrix sp.]MCW5809689.1 hypothetical protein [Labilithrix sp.]